MARTHISLVCAAASISAALSVAASAQTVDAQTLEEAASVSSAPAPSSWTREWTNTDFERNAVDFAEILSGGPPKDGIPAVDAPEFHAVGAETAIDDREAVVAFALDGEARAYPVRYLMWREIVNDRIGGRPITVTYCPLCNAGSGVRRTAQRARPHLWRFRQAAAFRHDHVRPPDGELVAAVHRRGDRRRDDRRGAKGVAVGAPKLGRVSRGSPVRRRHEGADRCPTRLRRQPLRRLRPVGLAVPLSGRSAAVRRPAA